MSYAFRVVPIDEVYHDDQGKMYAMVEMSSSPAPASAPESAPASEPAPVTAPKDLLKHFRDNFKTNSRKDLLPYLKSLLLGDDDIECPVCFDLHPTQLSQTSPHNPPTGIVLLRCGHHVCHCCLRRLRTVLGFKCPICRAIIEMNRNI